MLARHACSLGPPRVPPTTGGERLLSSARGGVERPAWPLRVFCTRRPPKVTCPGPLRPRLDIVFITYLPALRAAAPQLAPQSQLSCALRKHSPLHGRSQLGAASLVSYKVKSLVAAASLACRAVSAGRAVAAAAAPILKPPPVGPPYANWQSLALHPRQKVLRYGVCQACCMLIPCSYSNPATTPGMLAKLLPCAHAATGFRCCACSVPSHHLADNSTCQALAWASCPALRTPPARSSAAPLPPMLSAHQSTSVLPTLGWARTTVTRMLLLLAGDVERNPGPQQAGLRRTIQTEQLLGASDSTARALLQVLLDFSDTILHTLGVEQTPDRTCHEWNHAAMRALADCVQSRLPELQGMQGQTAGQVAHLSTSRTFDMHRDKCYRDTRPFHHSNGWPAVKSSDPDGNCNFNSALLSVLGSEDCGRHALRLLCALEFIVNSDAYFAALSDTHRVDAQSDFYPGAFRAMVQPGQYQSRLTCAMAATVLQCPVLLYCPGYPDSMNAKLNSGYMPPLFVREAGYRSKVPVVLTWSQAGAAPDATLDTITRGINHFEPMFFGTRADYAALTNPRHPMWPGAFYSTTHPNCRWTSRRTRAVNHLPPHQRDAARLQHLPLDQQQAVSAALERVDAIMSRDQQAWQHARTGAPGQPLQPTQAPARQKRGRPARMACSRPAAKRPPARRMATVQGRRTRSENIIGCKRAATPAPEPHSTGPNTSTPAANPAKRPLRQLGIRELLQACSAQAWQDEPACHRRTAVEQRAARLAASKAGPPRKNAAKRRRRPAPAQGAPEQLADTGATPACPEVEAPPMPAPTADQGAEQPPATSLPPGNTCTQQQPTACHKHADQQTNVFSILEYNPMGGTTTDLDMQQLAHTYKPDAVILPELKICANQKRSNLYRRTLSRQYQLFYSLLPGGSKLSRKARQRQKAGVLIGIARHHTAHHSVHEVPTPAELQGYLVHVRLAPPHGRPLEIIGVYMPTAAEEQEIRAAINSYIMCASQHCAQQGTTLITGGDWNATLHNSDRSTGTCRGCDIAHRQMVTEAGLVPAGGMHSNREPTYRQHTAGATAVRSRVDDVLLCLHTLPAPAATVEEWEPVDCTVLDVTEGSGDHDPLLVCIPNTTLGYVPPPTVPAMPERKRTLFRLPFDKQQLLTYMHTLESDPEVQALMQQYQRDAARLKEQTLQAHSLAATEASGPAAYQAALGRHLAEQGVPVGAIDSLADKLHTALQKALDIARCVCSTHTIADRHYLPRTVQQRVQQLGHLTRLIKVGRKELEAPSVQTDLPLDELVQRMQQAMAAATAAQGVGQHARQLEGVPAQMVDKAIHELLDHLPDDSQPLPPNPELNLTGQAKRKCHTKHARGRQQPPQATGLQPAAEPPQRAAQPAPAPTHGGQDQQVTGPTVPVQERQESPAAHQSAMHAETGAPTALGRLLHATAACLHDIRHERRLLRRAELLKQYSKAVTAWRARYAKMPRWGHRDIKRSADDVPRGLEVLHDPEGGHLTSDPARKLGILHGMLQKLSAAPPGGKTSSYTTDAATDRQYPWEAPGATDGYRLTTLVDPAAPREDLLPRIMDATLFDQCLARAANNKAAGWDEVPNELLKHLPGSMKGAIHHMFISMWITGETPTAWKRSHTILLYKKGDPADPTNYRPIGLALTVYKLWTSLLTRVLSDYAWRHKIIGDSQEGFLEGRNTHRQLRNVLNALEDAKHSSQNIYLLYIDFTSAFNTLDHDKLLQLMWDMGFPLQAVQVVQKLYSGATTTITTSFGETDPVAVDRGTLQGDTLSPFLFLLFIEPLLRWLHNGGRGYKHGCLPADSRAKYACSAPAYADDLAVATNCPRDMEVQASKASQYLQWAGMDVNHRKCGVTGMLWGSAGSGLMDGVLHRKTVAALQRQLAGVQISGQGIPFLHPHTEPYKYLGVWLTPSLNWRHQMSELTVSVIEKAEGILRSMASCKQKLRLIDSLLKPYIGYSFCTGAYTTRDIARLDSLVAQVAKQAFYLSPSTPTAMVQEDRTRGGMGVTSLLQTYTAELTKQLVHAVNDTGRLGAVTWALLQRQMKHPGGMSDMVLADHMRYSSLYRAMVHLQAAGGRLIRHTAAGQVEEVGLDGSRLTQLLAQLRHDPADLNTSLKVPSQCFLPLLEVGVTDTAQLMEANGTHLVAASKLAETLHRHGINTKVKSRHKMALNRLTVYLNTSTERHAPPAANVGPRDLPKERRELRAAHLFCDSMSVPAPIVSRYPDGQMVVPAYYSAAPRGTSEECGPQDARQAPSSDTNQQPAAPSPTRPCCTWPRGNHNPHFAVRATRPAGVQAFLRDFKAKYYAKNSRLRAKYAAYPPPDLDAPDASEDPSDDLYLWLCTRCEERDVVFALYDGQDRPAAIVGEARRKTARGGATIYQKLYVVKWHDSIVRRHHLPMYAELGYRHVSTSPVGGDPEPDGQRLLVHWEDTCEPQDTVMSWDDGPALILAYEERCTGGPAPPPRQRPDGKLTELERQGVLEQPRASWSVERPDALSFIEIGKEPVHPELDVVPPVGATQPFLRLDAEKQLAYMHEPDGRWLGTITYRRLADLRTRFSHVQESHPAIAERLQAGTFEAEVALLLKRWRKETRGWKEAQLEAHHCSAPAELVEAVQQATGAGTELFASPLNVSPSMPSYLSPEPRDQLFGAGWDAYQHRWIGASFAHPPEIPAEAEKAVRYALANACQAGGTPVLCVMLLPDWEEAPHNRLLDLPQCVQLARFPCMSLYTTSPTHWSGPRPWAHRGRGTLDKHPGYRLVAIGNTAGRQHLLRQDFDSLWHSLPARLGCNEPHRRPWPWCSTARGTAVRYDLEEYNTAVQHQHHRLLSMPADARPTFKAPKRYAGIPAASGITRLVQAPVGPSNWQAAVAHLEAACTAQYELRYDWQEAFYTDGSLKSQNDCTLVGAAVHWCGTSYLVKPNGRGPDNTINRAELAAIHFTAAELVKNEGVDDATIFTDSLVALHLIYRGIHEPHTLRGHLHRALILAICTALIDRANRGQRTRLLKVQAHTGVDGNEAADAAAKQAASRLDGHHFQTPAHAPFAGMWMPAFPAPPQPHNGPANGPRWHVVSNLRQSLTQALHASTKTGHSNMGTYASACRNMYSHPEGAMEAESNAMWHAEKESTVRMVFKARTGLVHNAKLAMRYRTAYKVGGRRQGAKRGNISDGRCRLCGLPDGVGHMLGACSHRKMKAMYIERHNRAVRKVNRKLRRHAKGGGCYTIMDGGKAAMSHLHGAAGTRLPSFLLPGVGSAKLQKKRPDILRIVGLGPNPTNLEIQQATANKQDYRIQVIEVGFTADAFWEDKLKEKIAQHSELLAMLQQAGWKTDEQVHVILVGTAGTVYKCSMRCLQQLGLTTTDAKALQRELHIHAVHCLRDIIAARRQLESGTERSGVG